MSSIKNLESSRGGKILYLGGYAYNFEKNYKSYQYWKCEEKLSGCRGR